MDRAETRGWPLGRREQFHSQVDVLIDARRAAHLMGATPMDRPEDVEVSHHGDTVYVCLTKTTQRGWRQSQTRRGQSSTENPVWSHH